MIDFDDDQLAPTAESGSMNRYALCRPTAEHHVALTVDVEVAEDQGKGVRLWVVRSTFRWR